MLFNNKQRYGLVAKVLHWGMAASIIYMLYVGLQMVDMAMSVEKLNLYATHKSLGFTLLVLVVLRLIWRLVNITPPLPEGTTKIKRKAAEFSHLLLYSFMFLMPCFGILMSMFYGFPVSVWGWFLLPDLVTPNKEIADIFKLMHKFTGLAFIVLIVGHLFASLYHHFILKDNILKRMVK